MSLVMYENKINLEDHDAAEKIRRKMFPDYRMAAELVDFWKVRESTALENKSKAKGWLSRAFWQIKYLSAVGNGAEAERCRDGLFDPHWGSISGAQDRQAYEAAVQVHNQMILGK